MSISDGMEGVVIAIGIADQWAQASNGWNGPVVENALIMAESELPREMWAESAREHTYSSGQQAYKQATTPVVLVVTVYRFGCTS